MSNNKDNAKSKKLKLEKDINTNSEIVKPENKVDIPAKVLPEIQRAAYVEPNYGTETIDYDDVYDDADIASALEMGFIAKALADHKNKVAPEKHPDFDGVHCLDCDTDIPLIRLNMGRIRCVDCQSELEQRNKLKGRK